jgi:hypothetical protein
MRDVSAAEVIARIEKVLLKKPMNVGLVRT